MGSLIEPEHPDLLRIVCHLLSGLYSRILCNFYFIFSESWKEFQQVATKNIVTHTIPIPSVIECSTTSKTVHGLYAELCANKIRSIEKSGNLN